MARITRQYYKYWLRVIADYKNKCRTVMEDIPADTHFRVVKAIRKEKNLEDSTELNYYKEYLELKYSYDKDKCELTLWLAPRRGFNVESQLLRKIL